MTAQPINDGGPAFPHVVPAIEIEAMRSGMSLRDWFAGRALAGMLAHATRYKPRQGASANWHEAIAQEAYQIADAMLAARGEP